VSAFATSARYRDVRGALDCGTTVCPSRGEGDAWRAVWMEDRQRRHWGRLPGARWSQSWPPRQGRQRRHCTIGVPPTLDPVAARKGSAAIRRTGGNQDSLRACLRTGLPEAGMYLDLLARGAACRRCDLGGPW
jgi:hypothetical protein